MLTKIDKKDLEKICYLFNDIRFYLGKSVLQGLMGEAYVDSTTNPTFAILLVRHYCFMSGNIGYTELKELVNTMLKERTLIPSDNIKKLLEDIFKDNITKQERYSKSGLIFPMVFLELSYTILGLNHVLLRKNY